jgi:RNA polymerase sigma factor for flagellar operon FliA
MRRGILTLAGPVRLRGCGVDQTTLIEAYLPLVGAIARTLSRGLPPSVELDELLHDGVIGLVAALRRYDPTRRVGFSTYAGHRIRGAMLDGLRVRDALPRAVRRAQRAAPDGAARAPAGITLLALEHALDVPDVEDAGPEAVAVETDLRRRAWAALAALPPRDRQVLELRLVEGQPLRAAAARLGLSITRTAEIQARGIARLRRLMRGEPLYPPRRRGGLTGTARTGQERQVPAPNPWATEVSRSARAARHAAGGVWETAVPHSGP